MIEIESMPYCWIDNLPIDISPAFKAMAGLYGMEEAMMFTFDYRLNSPAKDGCSHVRIDP